MKEVLMFKRDKVVVRNLCFVLMPFRPDMKSIYEKIRQVVVIEHSLSCVRGDDMYTAGVIFEEIWNKIQEAQIVISDATGQNPNVFYEMGLAHALGKDVIIITQSLDDIPFDLRHRRVIVYNKERLDTLVTPLSLTIEELKWKPFQINQWLETNQNDIRVGLSSPTDKINVYQTPIPVFGRVVGLPVGIRHLIVGYLISDKEYEQGGAEIDIDGYWRIDAIHLGGLKHRLYFKIFDETERVIAVSKEIIIFKRSGTPS
jgi:hypothetical protein